MAHVCQMVPGWFVVLGFGLLCQEQLEMQLRHQHMNATLRGIGDSLKGMVKAEPEEEEEDGLGWGESVEGEEMEDVEVEEEAEEKPDPYRNVWTRSDMEAVRAGVKEGKEEKMVEVVDSEEEGEDQEEDQKKSEKKKGDGGGGGGGKSGGKNWGEKMAGPLGQAEEGSAWAEARLGGEGGWMGRKALQQWVVPLQGAVVSDSCSWQSLYSFVSVWTMLHGPFDWIYRVCPMVFIGMLKDVAWTICLNLPCLSHGFHRDVEGCCMDHLFEFTVFVPWFS